MGVFKVLLLLEVGWFNDGVNWDVELSCRGSYFFFIVADWISGINKLGCFEINKYFYVSQKFKFLYWWVCNFRYWLLLTFFTFLLLYSYPVSALLSKNLLRYKMTKIIWFTVVKMIRYKIALKLNLEHYV